MSWVFGDCVGFYIWICLVCVFVVLLVVFDWWVCGFVGLFLGGWLGWVCYSWLLVIVYLFDILVITFV